MIHCVMNAIQRRQALKAFEKTLDKLNRGTTSQMTINEAYEGLRAHHYKAKRYIESGWAAEAHRLFTVHIEKTVGSKALMELTRKGVRHWHLSMASRPTEGNRTLSVLSKIYKYAIEEEITDSNPCFLVKPFTERKRKRVATTEEIAKIGSILKAYIEDTRLGRVKLRRQAIFLYALLVTGARPRSLENAIWAELDRRSGVLTFDGKNTSESGDQETVVFPPQLMDLLDKDQPPMSSIFNTTMPVAMWNKIRKQVGCPDLWARDLRRTFATMGMSHGISIDLIGEILNQKSTQTTKIYAKAFDQTKTETSTFIADKITDLF